MDYAAKDRWRMTERIIMYLVATFMTGTGVMLIITGIRTYLETFK